ncbi:multiple sugar-binding transport ATP-binding protein MsmK [Afipia carboxidovorans OM5]|uniref:Spermidine/putrescine import ATP-binding protein PotA n=1 Tax=Afipia carboxidovorans (strain ATCC 49405 / DSM 1227 / KCTC 32145 / OM5) TaxID=504832 RepID=B6JF77_AFIC5|nr:ABC transporter ATP-binding protein [Afipia carboxidovorans]ACI93296.1 multiple sugar-binding transport ATP-binding protein MsmK [Afipia carboxidovorans OM5]AEI02985.1 spermidine/putrescine import ATP-binding protein PotA [Afipia carboxidovorans OM4]AEI06561.1 spermidine/putrescine import ATP-binding protein PotA [Afipia carboxidovorans OM5]
MADTITQSQIADPQAGKPQGLAVKAVDLKIDNVSAAYGDNVVLDGINLDIRPGELFALLGPSGCGKTTLLRLIAGFADARQGVVLVDGKDISRLPPWKRDVGMVFQSYALWPHMTVGDNVAFGLRERRLPRAEIKRRVEAALTFVGLTSQIDRRPSQLSGGQQQRVALARTIAIEPKILLLDEPLSNLDAKLRVQVRRELRALQKSLGLTTVIVTHDQEEANTICDRVAVMNEGKVQQVGTPTELYEHPANLFVAQFLGTANVIEGKFTGAGYQSDLGIILPVPRGLAVTPGMKPVFRPQDTQLALKGQSEPGGPTMPGEIVEREFLGSTVRYGVKAGASHIWIDAPFRSGASLMEIGSAVEVTVPVDRLLWLA